MPHPHYDHYNADTISRLDGPYGAVDQRANERIEKATAGRSVLDIGCGYGSLVNHLRKTGIEATGVDILADQIAAGQARFPDADLRVISPGPLPFPDNSFDTVVLKDSLHHLAAEGDIVAALEEIRRVCRRRLVVFEPNPSVPLRIGRTLIGHVDPTCPPETAVGLLERAGFRVRRVSFSDALAFPLSGGYVSRPILGGGWLTRVDDLLVRVLGGRVAWRYLLVADV